MMSEQTAFARSRFGGLLADAALDMWNRCPNPETSCNQSTNNTSSLREQASKQPAIPHTSECMSCRADMPSQNLTVQRPAPEAASAYEATDRLTNREKTMDPTPVLHGSPPRRPARPRAPPGANTTSGWLGSAREACVACGAGLARVHGNTRPACCEMTCQDSGLEAYQPAVQA